jgi:AhpD family alkylhydroperoxidase
MPRSKIMARVPYVDAGEDMLPMHIFQSMANAPEMLKGFSALGGRLLRRGVLDPRIRELVINAIALKTGCAYEWSHHVGMARDAGVTDEELRALREDRLESLGAVERTCVEYARAVDDVKVTADDVARLRTEGLSDAQIVELTILAGFYGMTARYLLAMAVELDEGRSGFDKP